MRYPAMIFPLLVLSSAFGATPLDSRNPAQAITADYLLEACTVIGETAYGMVPHFDCETYLYGVLDAYRVVNAALPDAQRICLPEKLAPWQVYESLPPPDATSGTTNAAVFIVETLRKVYPCR